MAIKSSRRTGRARHIFLKVSREGYVGPRPPCLLWARLYALRKHLSVRCRTNLIGEYLSRLPPCRKILYTFRVEYPFPPVGIVGAADGKNRRAFLCLLQVKTGARAGIRSRQEQGRSCRIPAPAICRCSYFFLVLSSQDRCVLRIVDDRGPAGGVEDITIARANRKVWLSGAHSDLTSLPSLSRPLGIVADTVLASQFFSNVRKRVRHILQ